MRFTREPLQDANALLQLAQEIISAEDHSALLDLIVKRALSLLHGDRGFLVVLYEGDPRFEVIKNWSEDDYEGGKEPISRSILQKVLARTEPLHIEDASQHPDFSQKESVKKLEIRSVLAAPLIDEERRIGILYLESRAPRRFFREEERELFSQLLQLTARALQSSLRRLLLSQRMSLLEQSYLARYKMPGVVTQDERFVQILQTIGHISSKELPVLLQGAPGTGKELLARVIHLNSPRSKKPFVCVNCATTSPQALEDELFGALFSAHQGTLFLDELSALPLELQPKLLRALQQGEVSLSAHKTKRIDVRVVAATKRDLAQETEEERFREDLFYHLSAVTFQLPRLRERPGDILLLFYHFVTELCTKEGRQAPKVTPGVEKLLESYSWPGNIRELESEVRRLLALTTSDWLGVERISERISRAPAIKTNLLLRLDEQERESILEHLKASEGNRSQAAETLGISREGLRKMLKRHGLEGFRFEGA